jgi:RNA polymerase sigma-70 factor, ECF subfamily
MEKTVLERIASGDQAAMSECVKDYTGLVHSIARRMLRSSADADDAVQEIFIDVWRSADRFDPEKGSVKAFVATIARRRCIDRVRKDMRHPLTASEDELESARWAVPGTAGETLADAERAAHVVARLRPSRRRVLRMGLLQGMTHSEISRATGMPLGTVKTQMRRGLMQVRQWMHLEPLRPAEDTGF